MEALAYLRELNFASTALRLALVVIFGGAIGMEREYKRYPAGFRTYMLVCIGAATTVMLGQYLYIMLTTRWADVAESVGTLTDVSRFGAQVINGIGFLGAGTIIVTSQSEVRGLTTAAGLWASACMGLAVGAGFYECVVVGFVLIFLSVKVLPRVESMILATSKTLTVYIEANCFEDLQTIIAGVHAHQGEINSVDIERSHHNGKDPAFVLSIHVPKRHAHLPILSTLSALECVNSIEEL